ncbi:hypothetical protein [Microseira sp. BLCC-F43]|jgi:hypothetical protein|uniref:hypothetical protein n=1 Tax=Microseira sp. BLCC-F43 TaxID=3153602 RepID=UPI0035B8E541
MYLHIYQQFGPGYPAEIVCTKKAAAHLIYCLALALSSETEQQITLACKDGEFYPVKIRINENMKNDDIVEFPYLCDSDICWTLMPPDKISDSDDADVNKIEF